MSNVPEKIVRECKSCQQFGPLENMKNCPGCNGSFHVFCLGAMENIFHEGWRCSSCLAAADIPVSESTTIPSTAVPTTTTTDASGLLTEQAKADLQWISEQREWYLREVERQQSELDRKKDELDKLSREAAVAVLNKSRQPVVNGSAQPITETGIWIQKMIEELKSISTSSPNPALLDGTTSTPISSNSSNLPLSQLTGGTFTVLNRPPTLSTGYPAIPRNISSTSSSGYLPPNRNTAPPASLAQLQQQQEPSQYQQLPPQSHQAPPQHQQVSQLQQYQWQKQQQETQQPQGSLQQQAPQQYPGAQQQLGPQQQQQGPQQQQQGPQQQQQGPQQQQQGPQQQQQGPQQQQQGPQQQQQGLYQQLWPQQQLGPQQLALQQQIRLERQQGPPRLQEWLPEQQGWPQQQQGWPQQQNGWQQQQQGLPQQQGWPQQQGSPQQQGWPPQQRWSQQQGWSQPGSWTGCTQPDTTVPSPPNHLPPCPTPQQLLARQIMPKDLPSFYGNPEDWPLFFSAYTNSTNACGYSNVENMARLQRALHGRAFEQVKGRLLNPALVPQAISTLYMLYGRPELIIQALLDKVRETPAPKADKLDALITYGMAVQNLCDHMEAAGQEAHLCNPVLLRELVDKLPAQQRLNWALFKQQFPVVNLSTFAAYMTMLVAAASEVTTVTDCKQSRPGRSERHGEKSYLNMHADGGPPASEDHSIEETPKKDVGEILCLACNGKDHKVKNCTNFANWEPDLRWKLVKDNHLCWTCLGRHGRRPCKLRTRCGVEGCSERHHELLHYAVQKPQTQPKEECNTSEASNRRGDGLNAHHATRKSTMFRILPVTISWKGRSADTFAFLDDGSDLTLVDQSIAEHLGIDDGEPSPLCLSWTSNVTRQEPKSQRVQLAISGKNKNEMYALNDTRTVASLNLPSQTLRYADLARKFSYLRGLPVTSYETATPGILIGSNNAGLIATLNLREGQLGEPLASKTRLGWAIYGYTSDGPKSTNFALHVCKCQNISGSDQELHDLVKRHFAIESTGVSAEKQLESEEDKRARRILAETTKRVSGRFETGLLWRNDVVKLPNSYGMAMRRLECFERRMRKDPELQQSVRCQIKEYLDNGYIHEVTAQEMESANPHKVWYLPLGAVRNPKKPGKIRLVWDAAAKVGDVSLNSNLLKGPDLLKPLASVLCSFRERPVAICGDLKQMFHQFKIRKDDVHSQRFLYRDNPSDPVKVFAMDVGSFGATCSPSQAQYIKNLNAMEHAVEFPEAAEAIVEKHYVDDYLDSFDTESEAIKVALDVKEVHARGGFEIRNWHSNSKALLKRVGEPKQTQARAVCIDAENEAERVLGLLWLPEEDVLAFATQLQLDGIPPTKRNILRCVMSLFDSQGILSHITIQGRMIIQDTWRNKTKWDDEVIESIRARWLRWTKLFKRVGEIKLHRAYFPGFSAAEIGSVELHVFTDASEEAYACTAYFRAVINGKVYVTLAMAKAKVAPIKALSVPRLELMGALLGARLAKAVMEYHSFPICRRVFWTDSKTTLAWIQSEHRRYRQFVAFRVGEILSKTDAIEWRYVPTLFNPADEATKWGKGPSTDVMSRWFCGPEFLYQPESEWPEQSSTEGLETDEELRPCMAHREHQQEGAYEINRFSRWELLLRSTAYVHRFVGNCIRKKQGQPLALGCLKGEELQKAENSLWRTAQESAYPDELAILKQGDKQIKKAIGRTSPIYKLSPFLDDDGVMRVDSRIGAVPYVTYDFKFPIILPRHHHLTKLIVDWYHRRYLHANHRTVHNEVRQRFHISNLYTVILQIAKNCQTCKNDKATPAVPRMAPLPESRVAVGIRPFSFVGLDYFGPISVRIGRSCVKRWIALFTCLTVRAVHLEVVHSLSTESCKMAVRRFVSRRGFPVEIHSDNGTNFQGASRELKEEIAAIGQGLAETFTSSNTNWIFIPPSAPHFGGAWERLVRSVKVALRSLCSDRNPDDETLLTVIAEAESIVNSRPLTNVPLENECQEALTPNHFILLSSSGIVQPPTTLTEPLKVTRTNWNMARQLVDQFWRRWISEYLPTISKRTKWFGEAEALKVDDLVLLVNEGQRNGWTRGRVLSVIPGRDGRIRQASIQTSTGVLRRPVSKLAVLPVQDVSNVENQAEPDMRYGSGDVGGTSCTDGNEVTDSPSQSSSISTPGTDKQVQRRSSRLANVNKGEQKKTQN